MSKTIGELLYKWGIHRPAKGFDILIVDIDNEGNPLLISNFTHYLFNYILDYHSINAITRWADDYELGPLPFIHVDYNPNTSNFRVQTLNECSKKYFENKEILKETDFLRRLYYARRETPNEENIERISQHKKWTNSYPRSTNTYIRERRILWYGKEIYPWGKRQLIWTDIDLVIINKHDYDLIMAIEFKSDGNDKYNTPEPYDRNSSASQAIIKLTKTIIERIPLILVRHDLMNRKSKFSIIPINKEAYGFFPERGEHIYYDIEFEGLLKHLMNMRPYDWRRLLYS